VKAYHEVPANDETARRWIKGALHWAVRYLEMFIIEAKVSEKAEAEAAKPNIGVNTNALRRCRWNQQKTLLKDGNRSVFHYDHVYPVSQLRDKLLELGDPQKNPNLNDDGIRQKIEDELDKVDIAWILKSENDELNNAGYRSVRPDPPLDVYNKIGIKLA
jgi:hypothetical protein